MIRFLFLWGLCFFSACSFCTVVNAQTPALSFGKTPIKCDKCRNIPDFEAIFRVPVEKTPSEYRTDPDSGALSAFLNAYSAMDAAILERENLRQNLNAVLNSVPVSSPAPISSSESLPASASVPVSAQETVLSREELAARLRHSEEQIHALYHRTLETIGPAWREAPENPKVVRYMFFLLAAALDGDQYEASYTLAREMMSRKLYERQPILYEMAGISAFMMNKFDVARLCFDEALQKEMLTKTGNLYNELIPYYNQAWKTETALRRQDALKGDLPRVLIQTSKGNVELELFEDSAPNAVASFLSLAENGFYDNCEFSEVIPGVKAQIGVPSPGYTIPDEFGRPGDRKIFRGSVVMMHSEKPNSSAAQFFITFAPMPQMDGKYTVFGRVVKGMDVVSSFERIQNGRTGENPRNIQNMNQNMNLNPSQNPNLNPNGVSGINPEAAQEETQTAVRPDKILRVRVISLRNHDYIPEKIKLQQN